MEDIKTTRHFVVTTQHFLDGGRGQGAEYGTPFVVGVVTNKEEGFKLLDDLGYNWGTVLGVANPLKVDGQWLEVPPITHAWKRPAAPKAAKKKTKTTKVRTKKVV